MLILAIVAISIGIYIFKAISLSRMAQERGISYHYFGWLPYLGYYLVAELSGDQIKIGNKTFGHAKKTVMLLSIIVPTFAGLLANLPGILSFTGVLLAIFNWLFKTLCLNSLYQNYAPEKAMKYTILSFICPIFLAYFLYKISKNEPVNYEISDESKEVADRTVITLTLGILALVNLVLLSMSMSFAASLISLYLGMPLLMNAGAIETRNAKVIVGMICSGIAFMISGGLIWALLLYGGGGYGYYRYGYRFGYWR